MLLRLVRNYHYSGISYYLDTLNNFSNLELRLQCEYSRPRPSSKYQRSLCLSKLTKKHSYSSLSFISESQNSLKPIKAENIVGKTTCQSCLVNSKPDGSKIYMDMTAGIIVIGDEILKGQIHDVNSLFLTKELYALGVKVKKISVIPDDVKIIAEEISRFSNMYTHVITTGGIGPTHDDLTYKGVAAAFQEELRCNPTIAAAIKKWHKTDDPTSPVMKMAMIPESSELQYGENKELGIKSVYPTVKVKNVTIFAGIPHLLQKAFSLLSKKLFYNEGGCIKHMKMFFSCEESRIAAKLNETVAKFPEVIFGSYPELFHSYYKTKITFEAPNQEVINEAQNYLKNLVEEKYVVNFISDTITNPWPSISKLDKETCEAFESAMATVAQCFEKYSFDEICVCYNGGKDCLVTLHLAHLYKMEHFPDQKLQTIYITEEKGFPQVNEFVDQSIVRYDLDCEKIAKPMKTALSTLLSRRPRIKAVLMGTRRIDPHASKLDSFAPTDGDWPPLTRVNPILEWHYDQVWKFIRQLFLPYCPLYDRGYTSIGNVENTIPNPLLERKDPFGRSIHLPAYRLDQEQLERKGRLY